MSIDPRYISAISLEEYFVDKDTGQPLAEGTLKFFKDDNRSVDKDVFTISGTAPNYTFVNLGSVITLSAVGTPDDGMGNNIPIYYYPYDEDGNLELYYVEVASKDEVPQFTREARPPNLGGASPNGQPENVLNFVPNGQFLSHNNIPADPENNILANQISDPVTTIAPGGWTFERPGSSSATDFVSFFRYGEWVSNPSASPRNAVEIRCQGSDPSDSYKYLALEFEDVNKFASATQQYTFSFSGIKETSSDFTASLYLIKNYGTGGSTPELTFLEDFLITGTQTIFNSTFIFGDNSGKIIGDLNDDYIKLAIGFPTDISFGCRFTDFQLLSGNIDITFFPQTTDKDFQARTFTAPVVDPDGYDIGLPLVCTKDGLKWDDSQVGFVHAFTTPYAPEGYVLCDGAAYRSDGYSPEGIPYRRLRNKLIQFPVGFDHFDNMPIFGTGDDYASANYLNGNAATLTITTNARGPQTVTSDGAVMTGFTFNNLKIGVAPPSYLIDARVIYDGTIIMLTSNALGQLSGDAGTSGFTYNEDDSFDGAIVGNNEINTIQARNMITVPAIPTPSSYFEFTNAAFDDYYVWFKVDGSGVDPAPGGTGILINLISTMDASDVAYIIAQSLAGHQCSSIQVLSGIAFAPNSYFNFYANNIHYYVWYSLNGAGTDPNLANAEGIEVSYQSGDSANTIRNKTLQAINDVYFAVPNTIGQYIKSWDALDSITEGGDITNKFRFSNTRFNSSYNNLKHYIGSRSYDYLQSHTHGLQRYGFGEGAQSFSYNSLDNPANPFTPYYRNDILEFYGVGQNEVKNVYLNYCIKL
jgi:hypothetical protein